MSQASFRASPRREGCEKVFVAPYERKNSDRVYQSIDGGDYVAKAKKPITMVRGHERCPNRTANVVVKAASLVARNEGQGKGLSVAQLTQEIGRLYRDRPLDRPDPTPEELYREFIAAHPGIENLPPSRSSPRRSPARRSPSPPRSQMRRSAERPRSQRLSGGLSPRMNPGLGF